MTPADSTLADDLLRAPLTALMAEARDLRDQGHGEQMSYSRKVFVPLTQLCRDVCHYCTFSRPPKSRRRAYLTMDEVLAIARAGRAAGCDEILFTLGDKPEVRWDIAREELQRMGHASTLGYLHTCCEAVLRDGGPLPHINPGLMTREELSRLREVSVSMGLMLENVSPRLMQPGQVHHGSPDKEPTARLRTIELAGELGIPFTSGILIGIGETRLERLQSLLALRELHLRHGHLQELIVQNFRAKPGTPMVAAAEPDFEDLCWTIAAARIVFGSTMSIQAPPNLSPGAYRGLIDAGINDWGGVSPVTPDHVNPEAAWPQLRALEDETRRGGKRLVQRLPIYGPFAADVRRWVAPALRARVLQRVDARGWPREGRWQAGAASASPEDFAFARAPSTPGPATAAVAELVARCRRGERLAPERVASMFEATGAAQAYVLRAADVLRAETVGDTVGYVVNRNINYTNVCTLKCGFCAFSKGRASAGLRGTPYDIDNVELGRRVVEAWARGATEVCLQGGIHPDYDGHKYLDVVRVVKAARPRMHVHAFSPLEVWHGASTLGLSLPDYLVALQQAGLGTLPGTAAEILDDEVRRLICPDKLDTARWLQVMRSAHGVGIRSTATIMFGHVERPLHWANHLLAVRDLQQDTGGFTEFVPLPYVAAEAPMHLRGLSRPGPTAREAVLMHAVARLVLHPLIPNIQASWVKLGEAGVAACLAAGVNDLGGTLMNESISRAAGAQHGQERPPAGMEALIRSCGRQPRQRSTLYGAVDDERRQSSFSAGPLQPVIQTPVRFARRARRHIEDGVKHVAS
jgi:FO synthase